eukprot:6203829-Pleurochrysis_carterae.AAC.1
MHANSPLGSCGSQRFARQIYRLGKLEEKNAIIMAPSCNSEKGRVLWTITRKMQHVCAACSRLFLDLFEAEICTLSSRYCTALELHVVLTHCLVLGHFR